MNKNFFKEVIPKGNGIFSVSLRLPMSYGWLENVRIFFSQSNQFRLDFAWKDDVYACFESDIFLETTAVCHYAFAFMADGKNYVATKDGISDNIANVTEKNSWKLSVNFNTPYWAKNGVMYHIFVDRFARDNSSTLEVLPNRTIHYNWNEDPVLGPDYKGRWNIDFFGGNLKGIEKKLDYLKSLGVTIIYLSPIVHSQSNHRYDASDYENVDPYLGSNEDLKNLCDIAHTKGMFVILDAVFNHTGNDSKYFNEYGNFDTLGAFQSKESPFYSFYRKTWDNSFDYWWGFKNLPVCDGTSETWKNYILGEGGIIDKWFSLGIDGLRLDVADELTDDFIMGIRQAVHRNKPDGFILGEVWKNPMRMNRGYISSGKAMDSVMNYPLVDSLIRYYKYCDIRSLTSTLDMIFSEYPDETIHTLMNFTSTHDISRIIDVLSLNCFNRYGEWGWNLQNSDLDWIRNYKMSEEDYVLGKKILMSYSGVLAYMPGIFSIFYGDEVGLEGLGNLLNRRPFPWGKEDFELLEFFKQICNIKRDNDFLKTADFRLVKIDDSKIMYERYDKDNSILVVASRANFGVNVDLPHEYSDFDIIFNLENCNKEFLAPYGIIVLKNQKLTKT